MASFYLDHDVYQTLPAILKPLGHDAVTSLQLGQATARDPRQLLTAARQDRVLVTHNRKDYELLHEAWALWPAPLDHAGILIIPQQRWTVTQTAENIDGFIQLGQPLVNQLYLWTPSQGWRAGRTVRPQPPA
ncbi:MAG TPA: DUF5615 family PIN-like protein [Chloroflexota bacterium]|nr:DUF5615 family PIN-like protein [Chloroflexota bacterium]